MSAVIDRPGVWLRAGMSAVLVGLDLPHALASLARGCDRAIARELLIVAERAFLGAALEREKREKETRDGQ